MARVRQPLIAGNWKMNGLRADALALAKGVADGVKRMQCLSCGHPFAWGNPSGTFEVVQRRSGDGEATPPPATGP